MAHHSSAMELFIGGVMPDDKKDVLLKVMKRYTTSKRPVKFFEHYTFVYFDTPEMCSLAFEDFKTNQYNGFVFKAVRPKKYVESTLTQQSAGAACGGAPRPLEAPPIAPLFSSSAPVNPIVEKLRRERDEKDKLEAERQAHKRLGKRLS